MQPGRKRRSPWHAGLLLAGLALLAGLLAAPRAHAAPGDTVLVSRASGADGARGDGASWWNTSISADGRFVAFASTGRNLHPDAPRGGVFVRDVDQNVTMLASRASGAHGESVSFAGGPSISADGRFVAFDAWGDLDPDAGEVSGSQVYVRDLQKDTTTLVSRASGTDGAHAEDYSSDASISADGRFVAFASCARNLHPDAGAFCDHDEEHPRELRDVFVRDLEEDTTTLVSRASGPDGTRAGGDSAEPSISADGRFVAFGSTASNLHPDAPDGGVFVRDLEEGITTLASPQARGNLASTSLSADGRFVAFDRFRRDGDLGRVLVHDLKENATVLASRTSGPCNAPANGGASGPSISADGRLVAFSSGATNLAADATRGGAFVRDLQEGTTALASRASGADGAPANRGAGAASISADGRFVAFQSSATNLDPAATDREFPFLTDVFRRELATTPPPPVEEAYLPAKLEIERARVRKDEMLVVRGSLDPTAAGQEVWMRFGERTLRKVIVGEDGQFRARRVAPGARAGRLKVEFSAFATLRAASQRLRAARRPVGLRIGRATLRGNRLIVAGRVRLRARRHARVLVEFNRPDCSPGRIANRVRVNKRGRFRLLREVPPAVRELGARVSVIHPGRGRFYGQRLGRDVGG